MANRKPRDHKGRFVSAQCPRHECSAGVLQYEGDGIWGCDGLADPGNSALELQACRFSHIDGTEYRP